MIPLILFGCTSPPSGPGLVGQVSVETNPNNVLSFFVTWQTDTPSDARVAFGDDGDVRWEIVDPSLTTAHRVHIYGNRAERDVRIEIQGHAADGTRIVDDVQWARTGRLPPSIPVGVVETHEAAVQPGWTLTNLNNRVLDWPRTAVMYDLDGQPVWYAIPEDILEHRGDVDVGLTADDTIMIGGSGLQIHPVELDLTGEVVWDGPEQVVPEQHHHFERLPDGTTALLRQALDPAGTTVKMDQIDVIDDDHALLWSWNGFDHFVPAVGAKSDWLHANAVIVGDDSVYLSARNRDQIHKIDRATQEVVWTLGIGGDFALIGPALWFRHQHAPELQADGSWLIYDNLGLGGEHTRVVRMALDETDWTAEIVWAFPGDAAVDRWYTETWASPVWGDADVQPNGNIVITAGSFAVEARIFEVDEGGHVVWAMRLPGPDDSLIGVYRSERIDPPGLIPIP